MVAWGAHFGLAALVPKLPPMCFYAVCTSPFVLSRLVLVLHTGPHCPQCVSTLTVLLHLCCLHWSWYFTLAPGKGIVSHHLSVSSLRCVFCFPSCGYFGTKVFSSFLSPPLRDRPGSVFFPTGLPTWLSICLPSCGGFATEEFLRLSCFERYHSLSLMAAMLLTCHLIVIIGCRISNMFSEVKFKKQDPGAFGSFVFRAP